MASNTEDDERSDKLGDREQEAGKTSKRLSAIPKNAKELREFEESIGEDSRLKRAAYKGGKKFAKDLLEDTGVSSAALFGKEPEMPGGGWYNQLKSDPGKKFAKAVVRKNLRYLLGTVLLTVVMAAILFFLTYFGALKGLHFDTVLRGVNFARYQIMVRRQFSSVMFQAATLTDNSDGIFRKSPLVRQIMLTTPDRQIKALGRDGRIRWDFAPNKSFGYDVLPTKESLKGVFIDGEPIYIDDIAKQHFGGRTYGQLSLGEKLQVQSKFVDAVNVKMGDIMALQPRTVRWNPYARVRLRAGIQLIKWFNRAREYAGKTTAEARKINIDETVEHVMTPEDQQPKSADSDTNKSAEEMRQERIQALETGGQPGKIRTKLASRAFKLRSISDAVFVATLYCTVKDIIAYVNSGQAKREEQALRFAADGMIGSDQTKVGDVVAEAIDADGLNWNANGDVPDASASVLYRQDTGQDVGLTDQQVNDQLASVPSLKPDSFLADIGGAFADTTSKDANEDAGPGTTCKILLNENVQYGIAAVELVATVFSAGEAKGITAGIKAGLEFGFHFAAGMGLSELMNMMLDSLIRVYAGVDFGLEQGADRYGASRVTYDFMSQTANRNVNYGRPMADDEANSAQNVAMQELRSENSEQSFSKRYFAIDNPFSLLGLAVARVPSSATDFASSIHNAASFLGSILSSPFRLLGSLSNIGLLFSPAHAAPTSTFGGFFGVEEWGWSLDEQEKIQKDPSFQLQNLVDNLEPRMDALNALYLPCYDDSTFVLQHDRPDQCTREFLSTSDALHWRYYNSLMFAATHMTGPV